MASDLALGGLLHWGRRRLVVGEGGGATRQPLLLARGGDLVIMVIMRKTSLADAKAHLSALVDQAEHHKRRVLILRHGKPAAALVPVDDLLVATRGPGGALPARLSKKAIRALFAAFGTSDAGAGAVGDLLASRR
jgi:prevent-host-death family protein